MSDRIKKKEKVIYGHLFALGYNGQLPFKGDDRFQHKYCVCKKKVSNGIKPYREINALIDQAKKAIAQNYTVTFTGEDGVSSVVEFKKDHKTDFFQIGRSTETIIDYIVIDTIPGEKDNIKAALKQSTISRYACRLVVDRSPPYHTRLFSGGFNSKNRIVLKESAPQWASSTKFSDGLTTNGVLLMHPKNPWGKSMRPGVWREVSISGDIFGLRCSRSAKQRGKTTELVNILQDGSLIDLCGVVLLWRTISGMAKSPTLSDLEKQEEALNSLNAQCPVGLVTLRFKKKKMNIDLTDPYVYTTCGHVHGYHKWGMKPGVTSHTEDYYDKRICTFCEQEGYFVSLKLGMEPAFYIDNGPATHCFVPCGHVTTEATVKYWSQVPLPHGKDHFSSLCPFCSIPLDGREGYVRLIFQTLVEPVREVLL